MTSAEFHEAPVHEGLLSPWRIGIDVGGTFTDVVLVDGTGKVVPFKSPSEPSDPAAGVLRAIDGLAKRLGLATERLLGGCSHLIHGTTVATNILLERKGAHIGLLTTFGFRDSLEIRRGYRELMWDHRTPWREVLVPRRLRLPVRERMSAAGTVLEPLDEASVAAAAERFRSEGVEAVAICLLHAHVNGTHERRCAALLRDMLPGVYITCSADLAPIAGEYERASTTAANAYVAPRVLPYLSKLGADLRARGLTRDLLLVQSNGGAISLAQVADRPAALALSGPAAGLASLGLYGRLTGADNLIAIEIGGTSCDVTVVNRGVVAEADRISVGDTLIALPSVEIHTIGTGGGTICGVDAGGFIAVGPQGAGARPGPACYGLGGMRATVTDAQLVLGRLRAGSYAGGSLRLDTGLAEAAIRSDIGARLGLRDEAAAHAIIRLVDQNIRHAIEKVSLERGLDPARFILVGAGGAGALHVAEVARKMGIARAFVPRLAGVFCAFGMCNAKVRHDIVRPVGKALSPDELARARGTFAAMEEQGRERLALDGFEPGSVHCERSLDLRYAGQQWPIRIEARSLEAEEIHRLFDAEHERLYASSQPQAAIEIVNLRLAACGALPELSLSPAGAAVPADAPVAARRSVVLEDGSRAEVPVLEGQALGPGHAFTGPAIVEEATTTIVLGAGDRLTVDAFGNYEIRIDLPAPEKSRG